MQRDLFAAVAFVHVFRPGRGRLRGQKFLNSHGDGGEENGDNANGCAQNGHFGESLEFDVCCAPHRAEHVR